ncbi:aspartic protease pepA [Myriangium duriaei CBS 260.36]|uniref:Aspartic protease pepA n=1 Tax=Myriangium duriaei CBS 260.36 TaxID=1168546 RepID=A0A9P4MFU4_9PEZI|nr:aspartic protease pepA [Myriangium duriaei CBS 260.36]
MPSTASAALVAAALAGFSAATPVDIVGRSTFTVEQVAIPKKVLLTPAQRVLKTYQKFKAQAPQVVIDAANNSPTGTVPAVPQPTDVSYLSPVTVGSNTLNLDFDTGSSDLWVFSTLQSSAQTSGHSVYNPKTSGTLLSGYSWDISYGDGSGASGRVYADKVAVGAVTATRQAVEAATSISAQFQQDTDNDGLLGLAFSSINTVTPQKQTTFFDTVKAQLSKALFAVRLRKGATGTYDFGFIDSSKYTGAITYVAVDNSQGFWGFTAGAGTVNGKKTASIGSSIADTGTTLVYLPSSVVRTYYAQVSGSSNSASAGGYVVPCSATLPDLSIAIGSGTFVIPGSYINFAPNGDGTCFGGIQANTGIGLTIFGDIFLKAHYVIFDESTGSPRLGFAKGA